MTEPRFVSFEVDRVRFAAVCCSQAHAIQVMAALARGRAADPGCLAGFGIRLRAGRLDEGHADEVSDNSWEWGA